MLQVPRGGPLVRVTHPAQHRFAQPPTDELHAERQAIRREAAGHRQGGAAAEVERLAMNVIADTGAPRFGGFLVVRILLLHARTVGQRRTYQAIDGVQHALE